MTAWENRFSTPDARALAAAIIEPCRAAFDAVLARLDSLEGASREVRWLGVPWRWTLAYRCDGEDVAFLVPDPQRPLLALPLAVAWLDGTDVKRLSRPVREGLARARVVGPTAWAEWELTSVTLATDLGRLLARAEREAAKA